MAVSLFIASFPARAMLENIVFPRFLENSWSYSRRQVARYRGEVEIIDKIVVSNFLAEVPLIMISGFGIKAAGVGNRCRRGSLDSLMRASIANNLGLDNTIRRWRVARQVVWSKNMGRIVGRRMFILDSRGR